jgi:protoporphyrinogen/coproporphyrinogen III oxidase
VKKVDYVIVGGGLSGLSSAWYLQKAGFSVQVLEAQAQVGGRIKTQSTEGWQVDVGANSGLLSSQPIDALIDDLGLRDQVVVANDQSKNRFVVRGGKLWALPLSIIALIKTPLLSPVSKLSLLWEPFRGRGIGEESIGDFVTRRLGKEWRDWVIDPFVSGIFAGNPDKLSVQAAFYKVWLMEKDHGSLFKGMLTRMKARKQDRAAGRYVPSNNMISFNKGMSTLPRALAEALGDSLRCSAAVISLNKQESAWLVTTADGESLLADKVVVTLDAPDAANLLSPLSPTAVQLLKSIESPPLAVVALGFDRHQIEHALDGFGVLIPRSLGIQTLGAIFSTSIFPQRAPAGKVLLSCFIGGSRNPIVATRDDATLIEQVVKDLTPLLGINGQPEFSQVKLWPHAIAQYQLGHLEKVAQIRQTLAQDCPNIITRANWHEGISIPDVVANAMRFARQEQILSRVSS